MKLIDLLESVRCGPGQTPASKGICFPKAIELPQKLRTYLVDTWEKSEQMREEVGGNLSLKIELSLPPKDNRVGWQKFAKVEFMPIDVKDGQFGNSVEIRPNKNAQVVANFHTHPSTPGGTNPQKCGYQPPSIEDVMAMEVYAERNIFVSFVVAHTNDLYAMVYVKGISQFSKQNENKINGVSEDSPENYIYGQQLYNTGLKGSLGDKGKRIKFPTDKDEEEFLKKTMGKPPHVKAQMIAELELEMNYGQEFSELIWDHLNQVCCILHIGLYKSEGPILTLRNY